MAKRNKLLVILISAIVTSIICLSLSREPVEITKSTNLDIGTNRPAPLPVPTPKR